MLFIHPVGKLLFLEKKSVWVTGTATFLPAVYLFCRRDVIGHSYEVNYPVFIAVTILN